MTPEQKAALQAVLAPLDQFAYGEIPPDTPYTGLVSITAEEYKALSDLLAS